ncbi:unnamed protein product [Vitrella brassicaformis CCMP3155]|uniref:Uncharacterized protein n=1 Tax=Vitrella brassicaformis (strain CCMP3155) TaxID=1169540 RepID=A0A0G4G8Z3_VITBC|nr:unnamed protein product [Vitrella brassicaformis CCMP3155]|mmetsp:Transcript_32732/g.81078  ORF Transcript_32732/g.81078 Transcript_32732/m.81078 type:complete len:662 (-) Transcript_32732:246-2231(-)|eukprot:CEM25286.1 unnamed protein product [Vitrella brassicaformis CCMP3155]
MALEKVFEDPLWSEIYYGRAYDTGERLSVTSAQTFRDALASQNGRVPTVLSLSNVQLGVNAVARLAGAVEKERDAEETAGGAKRQFRRVDLSGNMIGDFGIHAVRALLAKLRGVKSLNLANNGLGEDGARELGEELQTNRDLEALQLGEREKGLKANAIGNRGLEHLTEGLRETYTLQSLSLCHNNITEAGGEMISRLLRQTPSIAVLDLTGNQLNSDGVIAFLPYASQLRVLDLSSTGIYGPAIEKALCYLLRETRALANLSLAKNQIEAKPMRRIAKCVAECATLEVLSMEGTKIEASGVAALCGHLAVPEGVAGVAGVSPEPQSAATPTQPHCALTSLDLSDLAITDRSTLCTLAAALPHSALTTLKLNRNAIADAGCREIAMALDLSQHLGTPLRVLEMSSCRLTEVGVLHLLVCVQDNPTFRVLRLADNFLSANCEAELLEAVNQNEHLQELRLTGCRISHSCLGRIAKVCQRNVRKAAAEEPARLKVEINRLSQQQEKLRELEAEIASEEQHITASELRRFELETQQKRLQGGETAKCNQLEKTVDAELKSLATQRSVLKQQKEMLATATTAYDEQLTALKKEVQKEEERLSGLQQKAKAAEATFDKRKQDHPNEMASSRERLKDIEQQDADFQERATEYRQDLRQRQEAEGARA